MKNFFIFTLLIFFVFLSISTLESKRGINLINGTIVTPEKIIKNGVLTIEGKKIKYVGNDTLQTLNGISINLNSSYCIYPGLINNHDHLLSDVFKKRNNFYGLADIDPFIRPYLDKIYSSSQRNQFMLYGIYQNLFSGTTTVFSFDKFTENLEVPQTPIRILAEYNFYRHYPLTKYSITDKEEAEYYASLSRTYEKPFSIHIEEGLTNVRTQELGMLNEWGLLDNYSLLVHGIGFSREDVDLISQKNASLVWCPSSNIFLINATAPIDYALKKDVNVVVGTDSALIGSINLLDEIKYADKLYQNLWKERLEPQNLVKMITTNAAKALKIDKQVGSLEAGMLADIIIIPCDENHPYESLINSEEKDISLVLFEGKPKYGDTEIISFFPEENWNKIDICGNEKYVVVDIKSINDSVNNLVGLENAAPLFTCS